MNKAQQEIQLPSFTKAQRNYIIICYANGETDKEVIKYFRSMFPDYGEGGNLNVLEEMLEVRLKEVKHAYAAAIKANKDKYMHIPIAYSDVRIRHLQNIQNSIQNWIETNNDTSKSTQKLCAEIQEQIESEQRLSQHDPQSNSEWIGTIQFDA